MIRSLRLILTCSLLFISTPLLAQEGSSDTDGWQITERCLGDLPYPTIPQTDWDFEGVIFSQNDYGVRAIRTDVDTSYFVAFEGDSSFSVVGGFSPTGQWFAYPVGATDLRAGFMYADAFVIVSTGPDREVVRQTPWYFGTFIYRGTRSLPQVQWIDDQRFVYDGEIINPFIDEVEESVGVPWINNLRDFSPDFSRAIRFHPSPDLDPISLYDVENEIILKDLSPYKVLWLPDSSGFLMANWDSSDNSRFITLHNRDGERLERIAPLSEAPGYEVDVSETPAWAMAPDGSQFAYIDQDRLHIASIEDRQIYDTCLAITPTNYFRSMSLAWSPDSQSIVFLYDGYPIILNTETLEMQILRYETGEIIGWYPLP